MKTTAIILAAGTGERFGSEVPKQFLNLNGKPIIQHTVDAINSSGLIDAIVIVTSYGWVEYCKKLADTVVLGGKTRTQSTYNGLKACTDTDYVLIHDAIRPFVDKSTISRCLDALRTYSAVDTSIYTTDTIIKVDDRDGILSLPKRSELRRGQTPQAFRYLDIMRAYTSIDKSSEFTDDIGVALAAGIKCVTVMGSELNVKITTPTDLFVAERLMQFQDAQEIQPEVNGKTVLVFGGSGGIGSEVVRELREQGASVIAPNSTDVDLSLPTLPQSIFRHTYDSIIQCAGVIDTEFKSYDKIMNTNFRSAVLLVELALRTMKSGNLVFVGSSSAMHGRGNFPIYSASKAALNNFTESMADYLLPYNIRVNCVNPARTNTSMTDFLGVTGDGGLDPTYVAKIIVGYCSTALTGQIVNIRKGI